MILDKLGKMAGLPPAGATSAAAGDSANASTAVDAMAVGRPGSSAAGQPARRTVVESPRENPAERDRRELAETLTEFTPAMRIAFHGAAQGRRAAGEPAAGLEWRAVVDVRRRFDPAGWIRAKAVVCEIGENCESGVDT